MARTKRNQKAKIVADDPEQQYEFCAGFRIRRIETVSGIRYQTDLGLIEGKQTRRSFKIKNDAKECARARSRETDGHGIKAKLLTKPQRADAVAALEELKGFSVNLHTAAAYYAKHHAEIAKDRTVSYLIDLYHKKRAKRVADGLLRPTTYQDTIRRLLPLKATLGTLSIDAIETSNLQKILDEYKPLNRSNYQRYFTGFFNWCLKQQITTNDPVAGLDEIRLSADLPEIYTVTQAHKLMQHAPEGFRAYQALALFGGVRPDELYKRLKWSDIDLESGYCTIRKDVAKTGHPRVFEMPKNLIEWLMTCPNHRGFVFGGADSMRRTLRTEMHKDSGVELIRDGARHSAATYFIALHGYNDTAEMLGNSEAVLKKSYKALIKGRKKRALEYFSIRPREETGVVQFKEERVA